MKITSYCAGPAACVKPTIKFVHATTRTLHYSNTYSLYFNDLSSSGSAGLTLAGHLEIIDIAFDISDFLFASVEKLTSTGCTFTISNAKFA